MKITVTHLNRFPVKSMLGEALQTTELTQSGIPGDRAWAVKDEERGGIRGGKRFPVLMNCAAEFVEAPSAVQPSPEVCITCPDGTEVTTKSESVHTVLSGLTGSSVTIWPLLPAEQLDHYRRGQPDPGMSGEAYLREVFARTPDEPLPDLSAFPPELFEYESPPGTYFDAFPLLILTQSTLQALADVAPQSQFDGRRFRANVIVQTEEQGFAENHWAGKTARIGSAKVQLEMPCPRCVMTTHAFQDLPKDPQIMRALVQANEGNAGIYASVIEPGRISVGDRLEILEE